MQTLRTERLRLELLGPQHANALLRYNVRNREHLRRFEPSHPDEFYTLESMRREVEFAQVFAEDGKAYTFAAFEEGGTDIVALVYLLHVFRGVRHAATLAYSVDREKQGGGIATEAAGAVVRFAFDELNLHRLETGYFPDNTASGKVLRKLAFRVEGYARDYLLINGAWQDSILVSLTNANWREP
jgi:ribosomal-protein-alanine N-acetyltransferase